MVKLTFRPWSEFFDVSGFQLPTSQNYMDRLSINGMYYQANYVGIVVVFLVVACLFVPWFFLGLGVLLGVGVYQYQVRKGAAIVVSGYTLTKRHVNVAYGVLCSLLCLLMGGSTVVLALTLSALIIFVHSSLRKRSSKSSNNFIHIGSLKEKNDDDNEDDTNNNELQIDEEIGQVNNNLNDIKNNEEILKEQQKFRSQFRANMRAKYLRKKD